MSIVDRALVFLESRGHLFIGVDNMAYDKIFKTLNSQLRTLRSKGLIVKPSAKRILAAENYYNVINGYKDLFLDKTTTTERYVSGTEFTEIYALYLFDREIRYIFLKTLLKLENQIKTVIAYRFSEKYNHDNYLKLSNFKSYSSNKDLNSIMSVISTFQSAIAYQTSKHAAVGHYSTKYGYVPLWVLVNVVTFGNISRFYGVLKLTDRQKIAKDFSIKEDEMRSYLKLMSMYRNVCAHEERLYNYKVKSREIVSGDNHTRLAIPTDVNGKHTCGKNDLFALLICLKEMLPNKKRGEFYEIVKQIDKALGKLQAKVNSIAINDVLVKMGFPSNWKSL